MAAKSEITVFVPLEIKRLYRSWCIENDTNMSSDVASYITQVLSQHGKIPTKN